MSLDGRLALERAATSTVAGPEAVLDLAAGPRSIELLARIEGPESSLRLRAADAGEIEGWRDLDPVELYPEASDLQSAGRRGAARWLRRGAGLGLGLAALLLGAAAVGARRRAGAWPSRVTARSARRGGSRGTTA